MLQFLFQIAIDSFDNVRTVASLGVEPNFYDRYNGELKKPYRYLLYQCILTKN